MLFSIVPGWRGAFPNAWSAHAGAERHMIASSSNLRPQPWPTSGGSRSPTLSNFRPSRCAALDRIRDPDSPNSQHLLLLPAYYCSFSLLQPRHEITWITITVWSPQPTALHLIIVNHSEPCSPQTWMWRRRSRNFP